MALEWFGKRVSEALERLRSLRPEEVVVVHHDDADGLCSGAVVKAVLERMGYRSKLVCLEKLFPKAVELLHSGEGKTIFYCDIGSPHADMISEVNKGRNLTIILDHHDPVPTEDPSVLDLNLEHAGLKGEEEFSGATCCYLFAREVDEANKDLSYLALVGSCEIPAGFRGLNAEVLEEALRGGVVEKVGRKLVIKKFGMGVRELFSMLQVLGPVGYYRGGPELGVRTALEGPTAEVRELVKKLEEERKAVNLSLIHI